MLDTILGANSRRWSFLLKSWMGLALPSVACIAWPWSSSEEGPLHMATIIEIGLAETAQGAITGMVPQSLPWQLHPESIPCHPVLMCFWTSAGQTHSGGLLRWGKRCCFTANDFKIMMCCSGFYCCCRSCFFLSLFYCYWLTVYFISPIFLSFNIFHSGKSYDLKKQV